MTPDPTKALLSYQAVPGVCNAARAAVGCNNPEGTGGNPNNLVNCFVNDKTALPFVVKDVRFWLSRLIPLPDTLSLRAWSGTVATGPDSTGATSFLYEQEIPPGSLVAGGQNTVVLDAPVVFTDSNEFCIGVFSGPDDDAVGVQTEFGTDGTKSYIQAPTCDPFFDIFRTLAAINEPNFCIEAFVEETTVSTSCFMTSTTSLISFSAHSIMLLSHHNRLRIAPRNCQRAAQLPIPRRRQREAHLLRARPSCRQGAHLQIAPRIARRLDLPRQLRQQQRQLLLVL